jgi:cell division protein FtsZ
MINLTMAEPDSILRPRIAVMGVGGAGGNAINNMINSQLQGCEFIAANTDSQALAMSLAGKKLQLGLNLSRGLGAGSKPEIGRAAAEEQITDILACLEGADMLFVTAGMGGGTGTGATPVIARAAREAGILTVGVVTKPFHFEGTHRMRQAEFGISELQQYVDTLIVIPNQNLFRIANEKTTFAEAFRMADEVLYSGVRGITDLMVMPGFMNLDFADVKTVMLEMGKAMMGTGEADGENRAIKAAEAAISNPLLDDISMKGARGVLINITGGMDMTLFEVDQAANRIREEVDPEAQIKVGSTLGEDLKGSIRVSVIATGIDAALAEQQKQRAASAAGTSSVRPTQSSISTSATTYRPVEKAPVKPVASISAIMAREAAKQPAVQPRASEAPVAQPTRQPEPENVATAESVTAPANLGNSFFTMPQVLTPQMVSQQKTTYAAPSALEEDSYNEPNDQESTSLAARQAEMLLATQAAAAPRPVQATRVTETQKPVSSVMSPIRTLSPSPAVRTIEPAAPKDDIRVTQLTPSAPTTSANLSSRGTQRSQSLFQRITGFGLVRPSASQEDDMDDLNDPLQATDERTHLEADERSSSSESSDLLDIPAFLRRQTNH